MGVNSGGDWKLLAMFLPEGSGRIELVIFTSGRRGSLRDGWKLTKPFWYCVRPPPFWLIDVSLIECPIFPTLGGFSFATGGWKTSWIRECLKSLMLVKTCFSGETTFTFRWFWMFIDASFWKTFGFLCPFQVNKSQLIISQNSFIIDIIRLLLSLSIVLQTDGKLCLFKTSVSLTEN